MTLPLLRHPLIGALVRLWWLPTLTATLVWGFWGGADLGLAGLGAAAGLGVLSGVLLTVALDWLAAALGDRLRCRQDGHRFLCPTCLRFGAFRFACQACGREIPPSIVHTHGRYTDLCPHCDTTLGLQEEPALQRVRAYCQHCAHHCDRTIYHQRQVRVLGSFSFADLLALHQTTAAPVTRRPGVVCGYDDGERLTYLLTAADLSGGIKPLPPEHAAGAVTEIWLDGDAEEPLRLAADVDRFIQKAGWTEGQRRAVTISVRSNCLVGAAYQLLTARFGAVQWSMTGARFLDLQRWPAAGLLPPSAVPAAPPGPSPDPVAWTRQTPIPARTRPSVTVSSRRRAARPLRSDVRRPGAPS